MSRHHLPNQGPRGAVPAILIRAASPGARSTASVPQGGNPAVAVVHTCGLTAGGDVWCWGDGEWSRIGIDEDGVPREQFDPPSATTPMRLPPSGVTDLAVRWNNTCTVRGDEPGPLCWGDNVAGQLGLSARGIWRRLSSWARGAGFGG